MNKNSTKTKTEAYCRHYWPVQQNNFTHQRYALRVSAGARIFIFAGVRMKQGCDREHSTDERRTCTNTGKKIFLVYR